MLIRGITAVLIEQGLLNYVANTDHVEFMIAHHLVFLFTSEQITSIKLN